MKKLFIIFVIFLYTAPAFAVPGWKEGMNDNVKPYDNSENDAYWQYLKEKFHKKYCAEDRIMIDEDGAKHIVGSCNYPMDGYSKEVLTPYYKYKKNY